jgi:hypothetical protein
MERSGKTGEVEPTEAKQRRRGDAGDDGARQRLRDVADRMGEAATTERVRWVEAATMESGDDVKVWRGRMGRGGVDTVLRFTTERRTIGLIDNDVETAMME